MAFFQKHRKRKLLVPSSSRNPADLSLGKPSGRREEQAKKSCRPRRESSGEGPEEAVFLPEADFTQENAINFFSKILMYTYL
jgi:hypothetical protein